MASSQEAATLGTALEIGNGELPPNISRLIQNAPESFDDSRHGEIAFGMRKLRESGRAVTQDALLEFVTFADAGTFLMSLQGLPVGIAEIEADELWRGYCVRRSAKVFGEALAALESAPEQAGSIIQAAQSALARLQGEATGRAGNQWLTLVEDGADIEAEQLPPVVEIISGLLVERCKFVIGSGAKSFKTWLTMDMALSIAHALEFLGRATTRHRVLYVNLELRPQTFKRRLQVVAKARNISIDRSWFSHLPLRGKLAGLSVAEIVSRIIAVAHQRKAGVVVIDPLYKVNVEGEENSSGDQTRLFNELDRITTEGESTLILNDHFGKGNQSEKDPLDAIRGSSAKGGDVDAAMILRKHDVEGCFRVDVIHRELAPIEPFCIGWEFPMMQVRNDLNPDQMKKAKAGRRREHDARQFLKAIRKTNPDSPVSVSKWAAAAKVPRGTLQSYLPELRSKGWIRTIGEGSSARQCITPDGVGELEQMEAA